MQDCTCSGMPSIWGDHGPSGVTMASTSGIPVLVCCFLLDQHLFFLKDKTFVFFIIVSGTKRMISPPVQSGRKQHQMSLPGRHRGALPGQPEEGMPV